MISYTPFWETVRKKHLSQYYLMQEADISSGTLYRLRNGLPISTTTIDRLCRVMNCGIEDIIRYERKGKR